MLFAAFPYGQNIPGCRFLTASEVHDKLRSLEPGISFLTTVSRPDSILIEANRLLTERSIREEIDRSLDCKSVVISVTRLATLVEEAIRTLRSIGLPANPPYRLDVGEGEWEWCLVLASEDLPSFISEDAPFPPSRNVVPLHILDHRALLLRKRRVNAKGTRIMLGSTLVEPWKRALRREGVFPYCMTSRTLNQVGKVAAYLVPNATSEGP